MTVDTHDFDRLKDAALHVHQAITIEGARPRVHRDIMRRQRREWPRLWEALDLLMKVVEEEVL